MERFSRPPLRGGMHTRILERQKLNAADAVMVRDTKNRNGETLSVPVSAWRAFIAAMK